jgi:hypothetical protein
VLRNAHWPATATGSSYFGGVLCSPLGTAGWSRSVSLDGGLEELQLDELVRIHIHIVRGAFAGHIELRSKAGVLLGVLEEVENDVREGSDGDVQSGDGGKRSRYGQRRCVHEQMGCIFLIFSGLQSDELVKERTSFKTLI